MNYQALFLDLPHPILQLSPEGQILKANPAWQTLVARHALEGKDFFALAFLTNNRSTKTYLQSNQTRLSEIKIGSDFFQLTLSPTAFGFNALLVNITALKQRQAKALELASRDTLTGLLNRRAFLTELKRSLTETPRDVEHSLMMVDLNHFKWVNDTFGHVVGDAVLKHVAARLRNCLRKDSLLGRWGGDEFVIFLAQTPATKVPELKQRCEKALADVFKLNDHRLNITASIGSSSFVARQFNFEAALKQADEAMYTAKSHYHAKKAHVLFAS